MALVKLFRHSIITRAKQINSFRLGLLEDALNALKSNDFKLAKLLLDDYLEATFSLEKISPKTQMYNKKIKVMIETNYTSSVINLIELLEATQKSEIDGYKA